jgi:hypothetical protein
MTESERQRRQLAFSAVGSVLALLLIVVTCSVYMWKKAATSEGQTSKPAAQDTVEEVTICQLAADPAKYNHKLVKVTGFLSLGFEESFLFDPSCPSSRFNIWYDFGGKRSTGTMYCCGVVPSRTRPEDVVVEDIPIPLVVDQNFETLDRLLRRPDGGIAHGTVIGRFFSGQKENAADGRVWWEGYGHMGISSLFMVQQVLSVDQHDRTDVDYDSSQTYPEFESKDCFYQQLSDEPEPAVELQRRADADGGSWMFDDPKRVAIDALAKQFQRNPASFANVRLKRQAQGRMFYEWRLNNNNRPYVVAVTRPYHLVFYAKTNKVAWVPSGVYRLSCND